MVLKIAERLAMAFWLVAAIAVLWCCRDIAAIIHFIDGCVPDTAGNCGFSLGTMG